MNNPPNDWDDVALDDFGEIVAGGTPSRAAPSFWNGNVPWVTPSEITVLKSKYLRETREQITHEGLASSAAKLLPSGTLLVTSRATLGEVAIAGVSVSTNQGFKNIIPNEATDSLFAYYRIGTLKPEMERRASGTTFLEISKADFSRIRTLRPNRAEQSRIAAVLDTVDEAIAKTEAVISKLKQVRAGLLHDLLTRGLDENGQLRDPVAHPEQFQDSPLGRIPSGWRIAPLCEVADIASGVTLGKNLTGAGTLELPYLRVANVQDGYLDLADVKTVRIFSSDLERFQLKCGDVLMNEGGDYDKLGRGTVWENQIPVCLHQNHVFRVRCRSDVLNCYFLAAVSGSETGKRYFLRSSKQSTNLASINSTQLNAFEVPVPNLTEQVTIIRVLAAQDNQLTVETTGLMKLRALKSALMADLLTGRVRVPERLFGEEQAP